MAVSTTTALIASAIASTAVSAYQANRQEQKQNDALKQSEKIAKEQADAEDQAFNKANQKSPDVSGIAAANEAAAKGGIGGTLLSGAQGVDKSNLKLGKATLLGG